MSNAIKCTKRKMKIVFIGFNRKNLINFFLLELVLMTQKFALISDPFKETVQGENLIQTCES